LLPRFEPGLVIAPRFGNCRISTIVPCGISVCIVLRLRALPGRARTLNTRSLRTRFGEMAGHSPAICFCNLCGKAGNRQLRPAGGQTDRVKLGLAADSDRMRSCCIDSQLHSKFAEQKACLRALFDSTAFGTQILRIRDWYYAFFAQLHRNIISFAAHHEALSCFLDSLGFSELDQKDDYHDTL
jgi:hypothetical protein